MPLGFFSDVRRASLAALSLTAFSFMALPAGAGLVNAAEVGNIDAHEAGRIETRIRSKQYYLFGFGPGRLLAMDEPAMAYSLMLGYVRDVSSQGAIKAVVEAGAVVEGEPAAILTGGIGFNYYFTAGDVAPLFTADFGMGGAYSKSDEVDDVYGFAAGVGAGVALFRTSDTQLQLLGQYKALLKETEQGRPALVTGSLSLLF